MVTLLLLECVKLGITGSRMEIRLDIIHEQCCGRMKTVFIPKLHIAAERPQLETIPPDNKPSYK